MNSTTAVTTVTADGFMLSAVAARAASADPKELIRSWLRPLSASASRKYRQALVLFAAWAIHGSQQREPEDALRLLCSSQQSRAFLMVRSWRDDLLAQGKATSTVAGLVSAILSLLRMCRQAGQITWTLERVAPKVEPKHDRSGPKPHEVMLVLDHLNDQVERATNSLLRKVALRDTAIIRLLHNAALRRNEVSTLRMEDLDLEGASGPMVRVLRKGHRERVSMLVGIRAVESLHSWIQQRGTAHGPVFHRIGGPPIHGVIPALCGDAIRRMLAARSLQAGLRRAIRPHGLRHAAATEMALRGNLSQVQALGGWKSPTAAAFYLDRRQETRAGAISQIEL